LAASEREKPRGPCLAMSFNAASTIAVLK